MLQRSTEHRAGARGRIVRGDGRPYAAEPDVLREILTGLRRNIRLIAVTALAGTAIAVAAALTITPLYRGTATVLVDPRPTKILEDSEVVGRAGTESGAIESEVEMLKSAALTRKVAERLGLQNDDEFAAAGLLGSIKALVLSPVRALLGGSGDADALAGVADALARRTEARRRGLTYVIEFTAWSRNADKAARIANTFVELYLEEQLAAKAAATRRANKWLTARVEEMRDRVAASERALEEYRAEASLFDPGGESLSDQQIARLSEQLVDARAKAAQALAKYEQLKQITPDRLRSAAASTDVLQSAVISNLRGQYADAARQQAERNSRYGAEHPQVAAGRAQIADLERQITAEISRIVTSAQSEYEIARSREESLAKSLDDLKERGAQSNQASIRLRELERDAETNRELFKAFLMRARETGELDLQVPDSRVVSAAAVPVAASYPPKALIVALGFFGSLGLGVAFALASVAFSTAFRNEKDIEAALGVLPLASLPFVEGPPEPRPLASPANGIRGALGLAVSTGTNVVPMPAVRRLEARGLAKAVLEHPESEFAEGVRALHYALRRQAPHLGAVLVTSALPGEGKSTVAANLAQAAADAGDRTLLIDADLRRPRLASALGLSHSAGLSGLLTGETHFRTTVRKVGASGFYVIAGDMPVPGSRALAMLSSEAMRWLVDVARDNFDLVVLDGPPLLPVADARALADPVDGIALVVASERTRREAVAAALHGWPDIEEKLVGVVLNGSFERYAEYPYGGAAAAAGGA